MQFPFSSSRTSTETSPIVQEAEAILSDWKRVVISHAGLTTAEQTNLRHRILDVCVQINKVGACEISFVGQTLEVRVATRNDNFGIDQIIAAANSTGYAGVRVQVA